MMDDWLDPLREPIASRVLLDLTAEVTVRPVSEALDTVAEALRSTTGYRVAVLNVFHPETDDYVARSVAGLQENLELLGSRIQRDVIERLLADADRQLANVYFLANAAASAWDEITAVYVPDLPEPVASDGWRRDDALLVTLSDLDGSPLGFVSMDQPVSGFRPTDAELKAIGTICTYAEAALRLARRAELAEAESRLLANVQAAARAFSASVSITELHRRFVDSAVERFGFQRVASFGGDRTAGFHLMAQAGWPTIVLETPQMSPGALIDLSAHPPTGSWLLAEQTWAYVSHPQPPSAGRGPRAWSEHLLIVPWINEGGVVCALTLFADPQDQLIPSPGRRRALRLVADLAASVHAGISHRDALRRTRN